MLFPYRWEVDHAYPILFDITAFKHDGIKSLPNLFMKARKGSHPLRCSISFSIYLNTTLKYSISCSWGLRPDVNGEEVTWSRSLCPPSQPFMCFRSDTSRIKLTRPSSIYLQAAFRSLFTGMSVFLNNLISNKWCCSGFRLSNFSRKPDCTRYLPSSSIAKNLKPLLFASSIVPCQKVRSTWVCVCCATSWSMEATFLFDGKQ